MLRSNNRLFSLDQIVEQTSEVHSLPFFYERLNEVINHPRSSISDVAKIITEDQGLTVRLLKLANSPMFGYYAKVDSISKAVTIIGTQQLRDLALAVSVMGIFQGIPEELISMDCFWRHSIACGILARNIAIFLRESNVERFFVAGILHDVGQLVLCTQLPEVVMELMEESQESIDNYITLERERLGFDHAELGGALLRKWKIPATISDPVTCHHNPNMAEQFPLETAVVHIADLMCQAMEFGTSAEKAVPPLSVTAWERLNLPASIIGTILKQSEGQLEETFAIMSGGS